MPTILIVEDQKDVQGLLKIALKDFGSLLHAISGEEGLALARRERPDLILLDIMMPGGMDGLAMLRMLRQEACGADSRVVVISARTQQKDIAAAYAAGADDYLPKPFRLKELQEMVARHLGEGERSIPQRP